MRFRKAQFKAKHPEVSVKNRSTGDIPHLDFAAQSAGRTPLDKQTDADKQAFALANELTEEVLNASALVVATPMYNWGPPSSLKAWMDRGMISAEDETSAYAKALKQIPAAVLRAR